MKHTGVFAVAALVGGFIACTTTTEGTGPGGPSSAGSSGTTGTSSGGSVDDATCASRCRSKAESCSVPSATAEARCAAFCPATQAAISCLEATSCSTLQGTLAYRNLCPAGTTSSSTTSSGGSSSSGSEGAACNDFGDCTGIPYCTCASGQRIGSWECAGTCYLDCAAACN